MKEVVMKDKLKKDPVEADKVYTPNLFGDEEKVYTLKENSTAIKSTKIVKK